MDKVCEIRHDKINHDISRHENLLQEHDKRLDRAEQFQSKSEIYIKNICERLDHLISVLKWLIGTLFLTFLGFFIWYIQTGGIR